ncbi:MAG: S4 domain-containing protein, partial [Eubacteriales bacterium]|nr:S4 domain-containing protein [Eubacteriales bacterium]
MKRELVRLQKMLADCGVASRRKSEELIRNGNVKVNGKVAVIGDKVDPYSDKVYVKGKRVTAAAKPAHRYIMLNKPRGYVTTM